MQGGETLFGRPNTQAAPTQSAAIGGGQALGQVFTINKPNRFAVGGAVWCQSGIYPANWLLWNQGTGVQLMPPALDMSTLTPPPSGTGWRYFSFAELGRQPFALSTSITYVGSTWTPAGAGNYVFSNPGDFSYPFGNAPLSTTACVYFNGGPITQIPNTTGFGGRFYWDIVLETVPPRLVVVLGKAVQRRLQVILGRAPAAAPTPSPRSRPPLVSVPRRTRRAARATVLRAPVVELVPTGDAVLYTIDGPGLRWKVTMQYQNVSRLSTEGLPFTVSAFLNGQVLDPTAGSVSFAFLASASAEPGSTDWHAGTWDVTTTNNYVALAYPGLVPLTQGEWYTWVKIYSPGTGETVIKQTGRIKVY